MAFLDHMRLRGIEIRAERQEMQVAPQFSCKRARPSNRKGLRSTYELCVSSLIFQLRLITVGDCSATYTKDAAVEQHFYMFFTSFVHAEMSVSLLSCPDAFGLNLP